MVVTSQDWADIGSYFGTPNAPSLRAAPLKSAMFAVTKIDRMIRPGEVAQVVLPATDAYFMMLYLEDTAHSDVREDGSWTAARSYKRGTVCLVDMRNSPSIILHSSLCSLAFVLPRRLLAEVSGLSKDTTLTDPRCRRGERDPVISSLGVSLMALIEEGKSASSTVLRHLAVAICAHVLNSHCEEPVELAQSEGDGSLELSAPWRENAAMAFMQANMTRDISIEDIAAVAGLSPNYFFQIFEKATGVTPQEWLTRARIQHAKTLLKDTSLSVRLIADQCGFLDQDDFTKVFAEHTGLGPQAWRSERLQ